MKALMLLALGVLVVQAAELEKLTLACQGTVINTEEMGNQSQSR